LYPSQTNKERTTDAGQSHRSHSPFYQSRRHHERISRDPTRLEAAWTNAVELLDSLGLLTRMPAKVTAHTVGMMVNTFLARPALKLADLAV
jgi:hypothetical protein